MIDRIDSLQALRAMAFLGVFFTHSEFFVAWPALSVSIFFVMSGFLMVYTYGERNFETSIRNNFTFSIRKIKKLYPLHIITMICMAVLFLVKNADNGLKIRSLIDLAEKIFFNITLTQSWIPYSDINFSLNGVAWYLSVMLFLYFMFPWLVNMINHLENIFLYIISVSILILEIVLCMPFIKIFGNDSPIYIWFMYCFPLFRLGDFFIGCVLGKVYRKKDFSKLSVMQATFFEVATTIFTILVSLWEKQEVTNIVLLALQNWTTLNIPLATMWVLVFSVNNGFITKLCSNRLFIYIGNLSAYAFLIHNVVTQYISSTLGFFRIKLFNGNRVLIILVELILSIVLSAFYMNLNEKYVRKLQCQVEHISKVQ